MAKLLLAVLAVGFAIAVARNEDEIGPKFPSLTNGHTRIHISSERLDADGGFTLADEYIDLELGKAAYIETTNNVRTTWLVDLKDNSIYKYWPFQCNWYEHNSVSLDSVPIYYTKQHQTNSVPKLDVAGVGRMNIFGITGLLESLGMPTVRKQYIDRSSSGAVVRHTWLELGPNGVQVTFSETANSELQLSSIITKEEARTTTINILSIERSFALEVYNNELQLPLIYGCERENSQLDAEMQRVFDLIAADADTRYHLKTLAKSINFAGHSPVASEQKTIAFALTSERDAKFEQSPAHAHMTYIEDTCSGDTLAIKTVVDHYNNIKYEAKTREGTCTISNAGPMRNFYENELVEFEYSNGLKLKIKTKDFAHMLYGVEKEHFLKLEKKGDIVYAYFSVTEPNMFRPRKTRIVRRYVISDGGSAYRLDSISIWLLEDILNNAKVAQVYDFKVFESIPLTSDVNSAQAFDVGDECFLINQEMQPGREYDWLELDFVLPAGRAEVLKDKVDELKEAFYKSIRKNLDLNYLRIPKLEIFFIEPGFTVALLVLDAPPLHLIYEKLRNLGLNSRSIKTEERLADLYECSELCRKHSCATMTFDRENYMCGISLPGADSDALTRSETKDAYRILPSKRQFLPKDAQRLERLVGSLQTKGETADGILGFHELNRLNITKSFGDLRISFEINGRMVEFVPVASRLQSTEDTTDAPETDSIESSQSLEND